MNFVSEYFIIKEPHEVITTESYKSILINRDVTLHEPGQSAFIHLF